MTSYRCDQCGRFCSVLHAIWNSIGHSIEREVCESCFTRWWGK